MTKGPPMNLHGKIGEQKAPGEVGKGVNYAPVYERSVSMRRLEINCSAGEPILLTKNEKIAEGVLNFSVYEGKGCILPSKGYGPTFDAILLEKVHLTDDLSAVSEDFYPTIKRLLDARRNWGKEFSFRGMSTFMVYLMEWTRHILDHYEQPLKEAGIYGLVGVSQFPYNFNKEIWKAFCEQWGPLTNTLHHGNGELGMSLYDMKEICGLPILGEPYEEYLPLNEQLFDNSKYPSTVVELLQIHAQLCHCDHPKGDRNVSWYKWIRHFYRGEQEFSAYGEEYPSSRKKKSLYIPGKEETPQILPLKISEEGELTAFLALLLSRFVLPHGPKSVRPETFVMASFMAQGRRISLAPTVLGHICHELGKVVTYKGNPGSAKPNFGIHFVIGWLAEYFPCLYPRRPDDDFRGKFPSLARYAGVNGHPISLYQARMIFRGIERVSYRAVSFGVGIGGIDFLDADELSDSCFEHLMSIRSAMLPVDRAYIGDVIWYN